jgi:uncharacterized integral membrane protein
MSELIVAVVVGIGFAYFATQNTISVPLMFGPYQLVGIPLYIVVLGALLLGLVLAWIIHLVDLAGTFIQIQSKESKFRASQNTVSQLEHKVHDLELENTKLKTREDRPVVVQDNLFSKIRRSLVSS